MKHALVSLIFAIALLAVVVGLTISIVKSNDVQTPAFPPRRLVEMPLTQSVQGADAIDQIYKLHRMDVGLIDGIVAQYGGGGTKATLWIGVTETSTEAEQLIDRMTDKIRTGNNKIFGHLQSLKVKGITVYSVLGMGQIHYYYWYGNRTVWIAVDPGVAQQALNEVIDAVGTDQPSR